MASFSRVIPNFERFMASRFHDTLPLIGGGDGASYTVFMKAEAFDIRVETEILEPSELEELVNGLLALPVVTDKAEIDPNDTDTATISLVGDGLPAQIFYSLYERGQLLLENGTLNKTQNKFSYPLTFPYPAELWIRFYTLQGFKDGWVKVTVQ